MVAVINSQPMDASYDEIMKELAFARMVERGLEDSRQQRMICIEDIERRITTN
jgi:hypothetical protein